MLLSSEVQVLDGFVLIIFQAHLTHKQIDSNYILLICIINLIDQLIYQKRDPNYACIHGNLCQKLIEISLLGALVIDAAFFLILLRDSFGLWCCILF